VTVEHRSGYSDELINPGNWHHEGLLVAWDGFNPSVPISKFMNETVNHCSSNLPRGGLIGYKKAAVGCELDGS